METIKFKVIIVGGGPVGLTAAHALSLASIDFVVLERRDNIVVDIGASLILWPPNLRVMHQLGVLDKVLPLGSPLNHKKIFTSGGHELYDNNPFRYVEKSFGTAPVAFHRAELMKTLYESPPDTSRANILTGKDAVNIEYDESGVNVTCADDTVHNGSMVLGADGVHSKTRRLIRKLVLESEPYAQWDPEYPFISTYRCMWSCIPQSSAPDEVFETQHQNRSIMYITGRERAWIFAYEKLPEPTTERVTYTTEEMEASAKTFAEFPVNETLKIKDIFPRRTAAGMSNLEEGIADHWSWGRIVLVGDSYHKYTPNAALGFENGVQDIVVLCNGLHRAINTVPAGIPSTSALTELFQSYQTNRAHTVKSDGSISAFTTRQHA
ncbi:hypothetical protein F5884DRAFT_884983 [Xylogone sp. PMI_703]|nr:hypothetical protein F5884DRAFT_884983 [Xylogone sp. PMI_703]